MNLARMLSVLCIAATLAAEVHPQVDSDRAKLYFAEATAFCERDAGKLWGVSLCGPMVFADAATQTLATSEAEPAAPRPRALGFANSALDWGAQRWATYVWAFVPADDAAARGRLLLRIVTTAATPRDATLDQLANAEREPTFVRTFAYSSGPAYGLLLDELAPSWRRQLTSSSDLGALVAAAVNVAPTADAANAARRYDGAALRAGEERRETERQRRVAEISRRFVAGPVVTFPRARSASLITTGATPIPGAGTVFVTYRANDEWGLWTWRRAARSCTTPASSCRPRARTQMSTHLRATAGPQLSPKGGAFGPERAREILS